MNQRGDTRLRREKEERILEAAAEVFRSPDYDVFSDVQYQRIADAAGYSSRTVRDAFTNDVELKRKLVEYMLGEEARTPNRRVDGKVIGAQLNDRSDSLVSTLLAIGEYYLTSNFTDPMLRSQMALWPYAKGVHSDHRGSQHITDLLLKMYRSWEHEIESAVNSFVVGHSDLCSPKQTWLTSRQFGIIASALVEALSIRATLDPEDVPVDLPGKALLALMATLFRLDTHASPDGETPWADDQPTPWNIAELDRRRRPTGQPLTDPSGPSEG